MKWIAEGVARGLDSLGLLSVFENLEHETRRLRVLTYHRVAEAGESPDLEPGLISATPARFRREMQLLASSYTPISLDQLLDTHRTGSRLPERAVLVTFDDAYEDFSRNAWPIMRTLGIPATLFVPTAFPDGDPRGFWWDRLHAALLRTDRSDFEFETFGTLSLTTHEQRRSAYRTLRNYVKSLAHEQAMSCVDEWVGRLAELPPLNQVLGWSELKTLASEGVSVCSHGHRHALMTRLGDAQLEEDLSGSLARVQSEMGAYAAPPVLAYPANASSAVVQAAVKRAGYTLAFGGRRGFNHLPLAEPLSLRRIPAMRYEESLYRAQLRPSVCRAGELFFDLRERLST